MGNARPDHGIKLYTADSFFDSFANYENGVAVWYCSHRKEPVRPYSELIADYNDLDA